MTDTVFRKAEATDRKAAENGKSMGQGDASSRIDDIEPPFTDYEKVHNHPYIVDHYDLGKYWNTDDIYTKEVSLIEDYLRSKIDRGEVDNSLEAMKKIMKTIERTAGVSDIDSTPVKVGKVAAYTQFLTKVSDLKFNMRKYGA